MELDICNNVLFYVWLLYQSCEICSYLLGGLPTSMILIRVDSGNTYNHHTEQSFISLTLIYRPKLDTNLLCRDLAICLLCGALLCCVSDSYKMEGVGKCSQHAVEGIVCL